MLQLLEKVIQAMLEVAYSKTTHHYIAHKTIPYRRHRENARFSKAKNTPRIWTNSEKMQFNAILQQHIQIFPASILAKVYDQGLYNFYHMLVVVKN